MTASRLSSLIVATSLALAAMAPAASAQGNEVMDFESADQEMNAAIAMATETLPKFTALAREADLSSGDYMVKWAHATEQGGSDREHIWVSVGGVGTDAFTGLLANQPESFAGQVGDSVTVPFSEVSDWMYYRADGLIEGSFTTRVMLDRMSEADRAGLAEQLAPLGYSGAGRRLSAGN